MVRKVVFFLLFANAFIAHGLKSKDCRVERKNFPIPGFAGSENLSYQQCGIWDQQKNGDAPWRVAIVGPDSSSCFGTLITPTSLLTWACETEAGAFKRDTKTNWKAFVGKCFDERSRNRNSSKCAEGGRGQKLQVEQVTDLDIPNMYGINSWKIKSAQLAENYIWPICLFNKNNQRDFAPGQIYFSANNEDPRNATVSLVADIHSCLKDEITNGQCQKLEKSICVRQRSSTLASPLLLMFESNRFFLRGVLDFRSKSDIFTDLLAYMQEIVLKSTNVARNT